MDFKNHDTGYFYDIIIETRILTSVISKISGNTILSQYDLILPLNANIWISYMLYKEMRAIRTCQNLLIYHCLKVGCITQQKTRILINIYLMNPHPFPRTRAKGLKTISFTL